MALTNTRARYGSLAKSFHWLTALLILTVHSPRVRTHSQ